MRPIADQRLVAQQAGGQPPGVEVGDQQVVTATKTR